MPFLHLVIPIATLSQRKKDSKLETLGLALEPKLQILYNSYADRKISHKRPQHPFLSVRGTCAVQSRKPHEVYSLKEKLNTKIISFWFFFSFLSF